MTTQLYYSSADTLQKIAEDIMHYWPAVPKDRISFAFVDLTIGSSQIATKGPDMPYTIQQFDHLATQSCFIVIFELRERQIFLKEKKHSYRILNGFGNQLLLQTLNVSLSCFLFCFVFTFKSKRQTEKTPNSVCNPSTTSSAIQQACVHPVDPKRSQDTNLDLPCGSVLMIITFYH